MGSEPGAAGASGGEPRPQPWRVFLSHTDELARHPAKDSFVDAARRAVERAGHAVSEMTTWAASPQSPSLVITGHLAGCQVYVGLLGFHYGSPPADDPSLSYTETEFDRAGALGLPRLMFLLDEWLH